MSHVLYDVPGPRARRRNVVGSVVGGVVLALVLVGVLLRLGSRGQLDASEWETFTDPDVLRSLAEGLANTVKAASAAIVLALLLGVVLAAGRLSDRAVVRVPAVAVVELFRAIPLVLLILFFFLGFADELGAFGALVLGLMLYNGSVLAEIFRAGIASVPRGQSEAAYALGMRKAQVMGHVLIPQAVRTMLPAIISQCVVALKDTALGFIIAYPELLSKGKIIYNFEGNIIQTAIVVATIYIVINLALSRVAVWLERRQSARYGKAAVQGAEQAVPVA